MIAIFFLSAISLISGQSISGSTSNCGGTGADPITCGKATVLRGQSHIGIPAACFNKVDPGPCSQDLIRIYYDYTTYTCKAFSFSGCGGNANRFVSIKNCYKLCHPYYRQRFISLGNPKPSDSGGTASTQSGDSEGSEGSTASPEGDSSSEGSETSEPGSTGENTSEETTTPTEEPTTTEDRGVLYFDSKGKKTEVKPEIQVVHEYDTFAQPQPMAYGPPGAAYGQAPMIQPPLARSLGGAPTQYGVLENIQHENYAPIGGYIKTPQGQYESSPQKEQQITYTH